MAEHPGKQAIHRVGAGAAALHEPGVIFEPDQFAAKVLFNRIPFLGRALARAHLRALMEDVPQQPIVVINGPQDGACANPQRQGLSADLLDGFRPNNVLGGIPTIATDYSPFWDAQLFEWTSDAISKGYRAQVREEFQILTFVQDGLITGPGGARFSSAGFSINCPIVQRLL